VCDTGNFINILFLKQNKTFVCAGSYSGFFASTDLQPVILKEKIKE